MRIIIKEKKKQGVFTTQKNEKNSLGSLSDQLEGHENIIGKENSIVVEYVEQAVDGYDNNIEQQPWEEEDVGTYKDDHRGFENRRVCMFVCMYVCICLFVCLIVCFSFSYLHILIISHSIIILSFLFISPSRYKFYS